MSKGSKFSAVHNIVDSIDLVETPILEPCCAFSSTYVKSPQNGKPLVFTVVSHDIGVSSDYAFMSIYDPATIIVGSAVYESEYLAFSDVIPYIYQHIMVDNGYRDKYFDYNDKYKSYDKAFSTPGASESPHTFSFVVPVLSIGSEEVISELDCILYRYKSNTQNYDGQQLNGWLIPIHYILHTVEPEDIGKPQKPATLNDSFESVKKFIDEMQTTLTTSNKFSKSIKLTKKDANFHNQLTLDFNTSEKKDNRNTMPSICKYSTLKIDDVKFISKNYNYDNVPEGQIFCSCPAIVNNNPNALSRCGFGIFTQTECSYYDPESYVLSTYTHSVEGQNDEVHSYSVVSHVANNLQSKVDIINNINDQVTYTMSIPKVATKQEIIEECNAVLAEHSSHYNLSLEDFTVNYPVNEQTSEVNKKSFILSLVEE